MAKEITVPPGSRVIVRPRRGRRDYPDWRAKFPRDAAKAWDPSFAGLADDTGTFTCPQLVAQKITFNTKEPEIGSTSDTSYSRITVDRDGTYRINFAATWNNNGSISGAGDLSHISIYVNDVELTGPFRRESAHLTQQRQCLSFTFRIELDAEDYVEAWVVNTVSTTRDINVYQAMLGVERVGDKPP